MLRLCENDNSLQVEATCRNLDFTLKFEQSFLSLLPNACFLVLVMVQLVRCRSRPNILLHIWYRDLILWSKMMLCVMLCATNIGCVVVLVDKGLPNTTVPSLVLRTVTSTFLAWNSVKEHQTTPRPSSLNMIYALSMGLFAAVETRSLVAIGLSSSVVSWPAAISACFLALSVAESLEKRGLIKESYLEAARITTTSLPAKPLFIHLFPLLYTAHRRALTLGDLTAIPQAQTAEQARVRLSEAIQNQGKYGLFGALLKTYGWDMAGAVGPRMVLLLATFGQVFLVQDITTFVSNKDVADDKGWALVGGFVVIYMAIPISTCLYWEKSFNFVVECRSALVGILYEKLLRSATAEAHDLGKDGFATNVNVDVERVCSFLEEVHELWAGVISIILSLIMLWYQTRWAMFAPLLLIAVILVATTKLGPYVGKNQKRFMVKLDKRVKLLSSVLTQLVPIKLSGYETIIGERIKSIRLEELSVLRQAVKWIIWSASLGYFASTFSGPACIGVYLIMLSTGAISKPLDASRLFTVLTIVNLLAPSMRLISQSLPGIMSTRASLNRIRATLGLAEAVLQLPLQTPAGIELTEKMKDDGFTAPFEIVDGTFGWNEKSPIISNINLTLRPHSLNLVIGPAGSGKSTLLATILGETVKIAGNTMNTPGRVAFAQQNPFLMQATIRDNILFGQEYERGAYERILSACALDHDLQYFPDRDQTVLRQGGDNLSGGQRHRISLARALYADTRLVLLDDVFSALDTHTENHIWEALFGTHGMLLDRTVCLVTHSRRRIAETRAQVVCLINGQISMTLDSKNHAASVFPINSDTPSESISTTLAAGPKDCGQMDIQEETLSKPSQVSPYRVYASALGVRSSFQSIVMAIVTFAILQGINGYLAHFSSTGGLSANGRFMGGYLALAAGFVLGQALTQLYFYRAAAIHASSKLHENALDGLLNSTFSFVRSVPSGELVNRLTGDMMQCDTAFPHAILNSSFQFLTIWGVLVFVCIASPWLTFTIPILAPLYWLLFRIYLASSKQLQRLESSSKGPVLAQFSETLSGLMTIRAFQAERVFSRKQDEHLDASQGPRSFRYAGQNFLRVMLAWLMTILTILLSVVVIVLRRKTSAGFLGAALSQITGLGAALSGFMIRYAGMENGVIAVHRIHDLALAPKEENACEAPKGKNDGSVVLNNCGLRYRAHSRLVLREIHLDVTSGTRVGICGRSGAGKSSLINVLLRGVEDALLSGDIRVGGSEFSRVSKQALRQSVSLVNQEPLLFQDTIRFNLDPTGTCAEDDLWEALRKVNLDNTISALHDRLETVLGGSGVLSKGQQQLLCLARALLQSRPIVILDESTSSIDETTDASLQRVLKRAFAGVTVITIAHRVSLLSQSCDLIAVFDQGSMAEFGTPQELLSIPTSMLSALVLCQMPALAIGRCQE